MSKLEELEAEWAVVRNAADAAHIAAHNAKINAINSCPVAVAAIKNSNDADKVMDAVYFALIKELDKGIQDVKRLDKEIQIVNERLRALER